MSVSVDPGSMELTQQQVLQKLCELGTPAERAAVSNILEGNLLALSLNMYGCRVLQKVRRVT
jgi:Pumilio-family RNA binding repeat